jgi:3-hydroxyacyl-CoA dehydrogenase
LPHEVDTLTGFGLVMGPCAMADLAGNDIGWRSRKARARRRPWRMRSARPAGSGQKSGRGYFLYPDGCGATARPRGRGAHRRYFDLRK